MLKSNITTDKYKLNATTLLTVKNEPLAPTESGESGLFKQTVTLKFVDLGTEPLTFADQEAIAAFIDGLDLEDEQQELPLQKDAA